MASMECQEQSQGEGVAGRNTGGAQQQVGEVGGELQRQEQGVYTEKMPAGGRGGNSFHV